MSEENKISDFKAQKILFVLVSCLLVWQSYLAHPAPHSPYPFKVFPFTFPGSAAPVFYLSMLILWVGFGAATMFLSQKPKYSFYLWGWLAAGFFLWWMVDNAPFSGYPTVPERDPKTIFFSVMAFCFPILLTLFSKFKENKASQKPVSRPIRVIFFLILALSGFVFFIALVMGASSWDLLLLGIPPAISLGIILWLDKRNAQAKEDNPKSDFLVKNPALSIPYILIQLWLTVGVFTILLETKFEDELKEIRDATSKDWYVLAAIPMVMVIAPLALHLFLERKKEKNSF
jgi:hypothetical protein